MRSLIAVLFLLSSFTVAAQREKEFQVRAGFGGAAYAAFSELRYTAGGLSVASGDTSGAAASHFNLDLRYEVLPRLALGLDFKIGSYLYDAEEDNTGKSNGYVVTGINADLAVVNRDRFRWYLGLGFNYTTLRITEQENILGVRFTNESTYRGGGLKLNTGLIKYFGDGPLGIHFNIGSDNHLLNLDEFTQNGQNINLSGVTGELKLRGVDFSLGLILRIR